MRCFSSVVSNTCLHQSSLTITARPSLNYFFFNVCPHKQMLLLSLVVNPYICSLGSGDWNVTVFVNQNNCALGHWNFKLVMRLQVVR